MYVCNSIDNIIMNFQIFFNWFRELIEKGLIENQMNIKFFSIGYN